MFGMLLAAAAAVVDPCALLTGAEIAKVQGEAPVTSKAGAAQGSPGLEARQCFFQLPTFAKSISLEVTRGKGVAKFWRETFHEGKRGEEEEDEEQEKAERVRGVGDEAFFSGGQRVGGLFVLRKGAMIRLSVGGAEAKDVKLKKLRALAALAVRRL